MNILSGASKDMASFSESIGPYMEKYIRVYINDYKFRLLLSELVVQINEKNMSRVKSLLIPYTSNNIINTTLRDHLGSLFGKLLQSDAYISGSFLLALLLPEPSFIPSNINLFMHMKDLISLGCKNIKTSTTFADKSDTRPEGSVISLEYFSDEKKLPLPTQIDIIEDKYEISEWITDSFDLSFCTIRWFRGQIYMRRNANMFGTISRKIMTHIEKNEPIKGNLYMLTTLRIWKYLNCGFYISNASEYLKLKG
jgi:hypothetical protein